MQTNLSIFSPFLAFLSACGTGRIKTNELLDENVHLISACQLAGFRHVVGTLWEVHDEMCVDISRITYEGIRDGGMTDLSVRQGLHQACRELREQWLKSSMETRGELKRFNRNKSAGREHARDVDLSDEEDELGPTSRAPLHWVPYVHFGI